MVSRENARNAAVSIGGQAVRFVIRFAGLAIISRLLEPQEVGVAAIALTIVGLAGVLGDFGLSLAAIAAPSLSNRQSSDLFWLNLLIGVGLAGMILMSAPYIAGLFGIDPLLGLIMVMAPVFLLNSAGIQHRVIITRQRRYRALAVAEAIGPLGGVIIGVVLAFSGVGALAIVIQELCASIFMLIAYIVVSKWRPERPRAMSGIRHFFGFSAATTATQVVNYLSTYSPQWFVGAIIGAGGAGQFSRAYQILMLPIQQLAGPLTRVALPLLSSVDNEKFTENFHKVQTLLTYALCFPLLVVAIVSRPLVQLALGPGWDEAAVLLSIMCIGGCFQSAGYAYYWGFLARNKASSLLSAELVGRVPMFILVYLGATVSAVATAYAFSAGLLLVWIASTIQANRKLLISPTRSYGIFLRGLGAGLGALGIASALVSWLPITTVLSETAAVLAIFIILLIPLTFLPGFREDLKLVWSVIRALKGPDRP